MSTAGTCCYDRPLLSIFKLGWRSFRSSFFHLNSVYINYLNFFRKLNYFFLIYVVKRLNTIPDISTAMSHIYRHVVQIGRHYDFFFYLSGQGF